MTVATETDGSVQQSGISGKQSLVWHATIRLTRNWKNVSVEQEQPKSRTALVTTDWTKDKQLKLNFISSITWLHKTHTHSKHVWFSMLSPKPFLKPFLSYALKPARGKEVFEGSCVQVDWQVASLSPLALTDFIRLWITQIPLSLWRLLPIYLLKCTP